MAARTTRTASTKAAATPKAKPEAPDYGQTVNYTDANRVFVVSNRFNVANVEVRGRELLALSPTNHVGPSPILVPLAELDELIADLTALRDAPAPEVPADEG